MYMRMAYQLGFLLLMALLSTLAACDSGTANPPAAGPQKPVIVASIYPLACLANELVDEWAEVHTLIPPGTSEHTFDLSADAMHSLSKADVVLLVGMGLDDWIVDRTKEIIPKNAKILRFTNLIGYPYSGKPSAATQPVAAHDADHDDHDHEHDHADETHDGHAEGDHAQHPAHNHNGPNPHVWLDPLMAADFILKLSPELLSYFPDHGPSLRGRTTIAYTSIMQMHRDFQARLAHVPKKELVTFHNAFDLMCARYGLRPIANLSQLDLSPGGEVSAHSMVNAIETIGTYHLKVVYTEPQFPDAYATALHEQTGVDVLTLDPLGDPTRDGYRTYFEMMRSNLGVLIEGQSRK